MIYIVLTSEAHSRTPGKCFLTMLTDFGSKSKSFESDLDADEMS